MFDALANAATTRAVPRSMTNDAAEAGGPVGGVVAEARFGDEPEADFGPGDDGGGTCDAAFDEPEGAGAWDNMRDAAFDAAADAAQKAKLEKMELLNKLQRLQSGGAEVRVDLTMAAHLDDLRMEHARLVHDAAVKDSIKMQRKMLLLVVNLLEWGNREFDPIGARLDGWSQSVMTSADDFDSIFAALHEKYGSGRAMAPEIQLMLALGGSAIMVHMSNQMAEASTFNLAGGAHAGNGPRRMTRPAGGAARGGLFGSMGGLFGGSASRAKKPAADAKAEAPLQADSSAAADGIEISAVTPKDAQATDLTPPPFVEVGAAGQAGREGGDDEEQVLTLDGGEVSKTLTLLNAATSSASAPRGRGKKKQRGSEEEALPV